MSSTFEWTEAERDALRANIAKGIKSSTVGGVHLEFQSLAEMLALLAEMNRQLTGAPNHRLLTSRKAL